MKKSLLTLSLLTAALGVAHAQSVVVLSGQLDVAVGATMNMVQWPFAEPYNAIRSDLPKKDADKPILYSSRELGLVRSPNGGSYLHIYAVEDFNNGLSAFARAQADFDVNGNSTGDTFWSHELVVGLMGDNFGQLTFGQQGSASSQFALNPIPNFNIMGVDAAGDAAGTTNNATLEYMTPVISGFQFGVSYDGKIFEVYKAATKSWGSQDDAYNHFSFGLSYTNDVFATSVTFDQNNIKANDNANIKPARAVTVGAMLMFPVVEAYYRFAYAARGFGNSIGETLYNANAYQSSALGVVSPEGVRILPDALNLTRTPAYDATRTHRYVHELGAIFNFTDRLQLQVADQFEFSKQPVSGASVPIFVKGSSAIGKAAWGNNPDNSGTPPAYVFSGNYSDHGTLKVYTNVAKAALLYRIYKRFSVYVFGSYAYQHSKLDVNNGGIRTDIGTSHYVYTGFGATLQF